MKTAIDSLTPSQLKAVKACIRDHGKNAASVIAKAWNTGNWASVTNRADHKVLHNMKKLGVNVLCEATR